MLPDSNPRRGIIRNRRGPRFLSFCLSGLKPLIFLSVIPQLVDELYWKSPTLFILVYFLAPTSHLPFSFTTARRRIALKESHAFYLFVFLGSNLSSYNSS